MKARKAETAEAAGKPQAVIYRRVSTTEQADSGLGLEAQEKACRQWAEAHGFQVAGVYTDAGISGGAPLDKCPGLVSALASLPAGGVFLVAKRDRLGRDLMRILLVEQEAERRSGRIVSVAGEGTEAEGPEGLFMRRIFDAVNELERFRIKLRTAAALAAKRDRRERLGTTPLGWSTDPETGAVRRVAEEQETVSRVRSLRRRGATLQKIADTLTAEGRQTKRGGRWHPETVRLLLAPRYLETVHPAA